MNANLVKERYLAGEPLNPSDVEGERLVCLAHPSGGETVRLHVQDVHPFLQDPDGFAARHFGLSKEEYREWVFREGHALCAAQTKAGKPCRNFVTQHGTDPAKWKASIEVSIAARIGTSPEACGNGKIAMKECTAAMDDNWQTLWSCR